MALTSFAHQQQISDHPLVSHQKEPLPRALHVCAAADGLCLVTGPALCLCQYDRCCETVPGIDDLEMLTFGLCHDQCELSVPPLPTN